MIIKIKLLTRDKDGHRIEYVMKSDDVQITERMSKLLWNLEKDINGLNSDFRCHLTIEENDANS